MPFEKSVILVLSFQYATFCCFPISDFIYELPAFTMLAFGVCRLYAINHFNQFVFCYNIVRLLEFELSFSQVFWVVI